MTYNLEMNLYFLLDNLLILCQKDNKNVDDNENNYDELLYKSKISISELNQLNLYYSLAYMNNKFIEHNKFFKLTSMIEEKYLSYIDNFYDNISDNKFILLELSYLTQKDVLTINKIFNNEFTFDDLIDIKEFIKYNIIDKNHTLINLMTRSLLENSSKKNSFSNISDDNIEIVIKIIDVLYNNDSNILHISASLLISLINNNYFYNIFNNDMFMNTKIFDDYKVVFK